MGWFLRPLESMVSISHRAAIAAIMLFQICCIISGLWLLWRKQAFFISIAVQRITTLALLPVMLLGGYGSLKTVGVIENNWYIPPQIIDPPWLDSLQQAQLKSVEQFNVFYEFQFSDRLPESGIRFRHRSVDDAGKTYKSVHYDHGNGIAVADVDGDGRYDIYFMNQIGGNELWRNLGEGKFEDITQTAGVAVADRVSVSASFADIDNDEDADLYVTSVRQGNILFENDGTGKFKDISQQAGLDYQGHSSAVVFFDYNRDGLLDIFLTNVGQYTHNIVKTMSSDIATSEQSEDMYQFYEGLSDAFLGQLYPERFEKSILFKNNGDNRFVNVNKEVGLNDVSWSGDASPIDVNEDGWLDLYVLNMQGQDEYYENVSGTHFVKKSREVFPHTPWGAMGIKVFDYNNDRQMDIFITDMHSDMSEKIGVKREKLKSRMQWPTDKLLDGGASIYGNAFYENEGGGHFKDISDRVGAENYWPWGLSVGDLNADGYEDVFIASSMNFPFRYAVNSVLLNNRGQKFLDSEFILGVEPRREGRTAIPWFELDCSGADRNHKMCQNISGRITIWGALGTRSSVIFDLDDDGDLDIVTNEFNTEPMVLISNLAERKKTLHFLKIKLVGTKSNRNGLGATVTVISGNQTYTKVNDGKSGYLSQSLLPLYFGLDEAETVDKIEVLWPSGQKQVVSAPIKINSLIEIREE